MDKIAIARNNIKNGLSLIEKLDRIIERWCKIDEYENYSVSTFGKVRNDTTKKILKIRIDTHGYYIVNLCKDGEAKTSRIHKLVAKAFLTNPQNKKCIDHIDRNPLNNHFLNLRFATHSENAMNKSKRSDNTSNYIGVDFDKRSNKYRARYSLNGKSKHIGYYESPQLASSAYQAKIKEHFKEFANLSD